ncbi:MAG TPA: hypothetical protein VNF47_16510 [Streptosporangiaceae bacterium]|nr:hypothetical protein [Streptosporangiaceae bacterium]
MSLVAAAAGSHGLWYVSRASGLVLLVLFSVVVVLGVAARMGSAPRNWPRFVFIEPHRNLALFSVALLTLSPARHGNPALWRSCIRSGARTGDSGKAGT